jgi:general stress protein 26
MATKAVDPQKHLIELVREFDTAMLVTRSLDGTLRARPMSLADSTDQGELWFVTGIDTEKVDELRSDNESLVVMQSSKKYLSIEGRAEVIRDRAKVKELWSEAWSVWFKDENDPKIVLIRVQGSRAEYWDNSGVAGLKFALQAAKAYVTGNELPREGGSGTDDPKHHAKVSL